MDTGMVCMTGQQNFQNYNFGIEGYIIYKCKNIRWNIKIIMISIFTMFSLEQAKIFEVQVLNEVVL